MGRKSKNPGRRSRTKGHQFERDVAAQMRVVFPNARRLLEYHALDAQGVDIQNTGRFKIQCKKWKDYAPINCISEIQCAPDFGDVPVLVTAGDNKMPVAVLPFADFLDLLKSAIHPNQIKNESAETEVESEVTI